MYLYIEALKTFRSNRKFPAMGLKKPRAMGLKYAVIFFVPLRSLTYGYH